MAQMGWACIAIPHVWESYAHYWLYDYMRVLYYEGGGCEDLSQGNKHVVIVCGYLNGGTTTREKAISVAGGLRKLVQDSKLALKNRFELAETRRQSQDS